MQSKIVINKIINETPDFEDKVAIDLFALSSIFRKQGFINKSQAINILKWKSSRPLRHYSKNSDEDFIQITKLAFEQNSDRLKIHILTSLSGVNYPSASALLMFYDKEKYPIIDIRVWKQLYNHKLVKENSRGQNFTLNQWGKYIEIIRELATEHNVTARQVEKRLFDYDKATQKGKLYKKQYMNKEEIKQIYNSSTDSIRNIAKQISTLNLKKIIKEFELNPEEFEHNDVQTNYKVFVEELNLRLNKL
jgi:hypothetical protein